MPARLPHCIGIFCCDTQHVSRDIRALRCNGKIWGGLARASAPRFGRKPQPYGANRLWPRIERIRSVDPFLGPSQRFTLQLCCRSRNQRRSVVSGHAGVVPCRIEDYASCRLRNSVSSLCTEKAVAHRYRTRHGRRSILAVVRSAARDNPYRASRLDVDRVSGSIRRERLGCPLSSDVRWSPASEKRP